VVLLVYSAAGNGGRRGILRRATIAFALTVVGCGMPGMASAASKVEASAAGCPGAHAVAADDAARQAATAAVLCVVNGMRAPHRAPALRLSNPLTSAATSHSAEMVTRRYFSHVGLDGSGVRRRVARTGYILHSRGTLVDETIAWGTGAMGTPAQLVEAFMESPLHRRTVLDRRYRDVGVGLVLGAPESGVGGAATTLTLDFGRR